MTPHTPLVNAPLAAFVVAAGLALTTPSALAQGGPPPGKGGGGHTTASTNLSYPAVFTGTALTLNGIEGLYTLGGLFGETWSYGCAIPVEEFPNTSCINPDNTFMDHDACVAYCVGASVERIYWQRESPVAVWQAGSLATTDEHGSTTWAATHVDWGDNLESQTWGATSVIRVETTTFATLPLDGTGQQVTQLGFQMWHVSGKGPDELWGVRATDDPANLLPFVYDSQYAIIHAPKAHISFTKLEANASSCPTVAGTSPFEGLFVWNETSHRWTTGDTELCTWNDLVYTVELNIGGKFVHGYNWQMSRVPVNPCVGYTKEGWWRLTYHGVNGAVDFSTFVTSPDSLKPPVLPNVPAPPVAQLAGPQLAGPVAGPRFRLVAAEEEADTGPLYTPVVDAANNLTYIDICIKGGKGGGGRR